VAVQRILRAFGYADVRVVVTPAATFCHGAQAGEDPSIRVALLKNRDVRILANTEDARRKVTAALQIGAPR